jgi:hypothetical protein
MTTPPPRFTVRRGAVGWMVWDREAKGPAKIDGRQAAGLSKEQAEEIKAELDRFYPPRTSAEDTDL